jgi:hypothetical protein
MENLLIIALGIVALIIAICFIILLFIGAVGLFAWASEQGFVGLAVYFALWIFLSPVMIIGSIVFGAIEWWKTR